MARHRRGRHGPSSTSVLATGLALGVVLGVGLVAAAAIPLAKGAPSLELSISPTAPKDPGLHLPFPSDGESAVGLALFRRSFVSGPSTPIPIASLTKLMTAYVTLTELPLAPGAQGPSIEVTGADVAEYRHDLRTGQSCVQVAADETLTERELLEGLIVHSANNFATLLARMVEGDDEAMVDAMNATAAHLGLTATSYADVSGFDPASVSNAADQLKLAQLLLEDPTFASISRLTSVVLPVAGVVTTYTPYLGKPHVVGVKSGVTDVAGGCDVMAYDAYLDGHDRPGRRRRAGPAARGRGAVLPPGGRARRARARVGDGQAPRHLARGRGRPCRRCDRLALPRRAGGLDGDPRRRDLRRRPCGRPGRGHPVGTEHRRRPAGRRDLVRHERHRPRRERARRGLDAHPALDCGSAYADARAGSRAGVEREPRPGLRCRRARAVPLRRGRGHRRRRRWRSASRAPGRASRRTRPTSRCAWRRR